MATVGLRTWRIEVELALVDDQDLRQMTAVVVAETAQAALRQLTVTSTNVAAIVRIEVRETVPLLDDDDD